MVAEDWLAELDPLTHRDRMRRMVRVGQEAARGDASQRALIEALWASDDTYTRTLALQSAYGSRDGALVLRALRDPSRTIRHRAMRLALVACSEAECGEALAAIEGRAQRTRFALKLHRVRRSGAVDRFVADEATLADPRNLDLVPLATETTITKHLDALRTRGGGVAWARLAKRAPKLAAREFLSFAQRGLDARARQQVLGNLAYVAERVPDDTLAVLDALEKSGAPLPNAAVNELLKRRPTATFDLLRRRDESARPLPPPGPFSGVRLARVARRLGAERLAYAVRRAHPALPDGRRGRRWFLSLAEPDRRAVVDAWAHAAGIGAWGGFLLRHMAPGPYRDAGFERWVAAARDREGVVTVARLAELPADLRHAEARRHLFDVPFLAGKNERLAWASLLPVDEAERSLASFLGHPEGDVRALAVRALIASVEHDRPGIDRALAVAKARKFEQDPVRLAMMTAFASLPHACFPLASLPAVGDVVRDALDASDLSSATAAAAERLVVKTFRVDPEWGAAWLTRILETRGTLTQTGLGDGLLPDDMVRFEPAVRELVGRWCSRERAPAVIWLASSLRKRLALSPSLLDALEQLARELPFVEVAAHALGLLREASRARFSALVPTLLERDPSFVLLAQVARFVSCHRQDLVSRFTKSVPMTGRFATGRAHWVVDFVTGFSTWTARDQRRYADRLRELVADPKADVPTLRFALDRLGDLAFADASALLAFLGDPRQPVREIAIDAAARLDAGQGVSALIGCLGDDRARWAIYALRACFAEMPRAQVLAHLRAITTDKVTVAKEIVRLLGELGGDEAFADLLARDRPSTHRDVRIAMLRALWDHLHRDEAWAVLERAASDEDWVVASRLADVPGDRLSPEADTRLCTLLARVLTRPEEELRLDLLRRWVSLRDASRAYFVALTRSIGADTEQEVRAAILAVLHRMTGNEVDLVAAAFEPAFVKRITLPAALDAAKPWAYAPRHVEAVAQALVTRLEREPLATALRIGMVASIANVKELADCLRALDAAGGLHFDAMTAAIRVIEKSPAPGSLEPLLARDAQARPALRRLALAAFAAECRARGWTRERKERLETYRTDADPAVASAAAFLFPPPAKSKAGKP